MKLLRIAALIVLAAAIQAEENGRDEAAAGADNVERIGCRVISVGPGGRVVVDRGERDGIAAGDPVTFQPRGGGTYGGVVIALADRSATIELHDRKFTPEPGTRGEVRVPKARLRKPDEPAPVDPDKKDETKPGHAPWTNKDDAWSPGMPLLAERPVRPAERPTRVTGRAYAIGDIAINEEGDTDDSLFRAGTDIIVENPFHIGGRLRFDGELSYLTEHTGDEGTAGLVRWLSYASGGTRFTGLRWEAGRFLQHGMPEFGVLDGAEVGFRREGGDRFGISVGFMPEPDVDFDTLNDFQVAAFYEWISDAREQLTIGVGFQKTWHEGQADRDLFIARLHYRPLSGWQVHGTVWVDFYNGGDDAKGSGVEVTQAIVSAIRRWADGSGLQFTYTRLAFPELMRNEFLPAVMNELASGRYDRLAVDGWKQLAPGRRVRAHLSGWDDEDGTGGAVEIGLDLDEFLAKKGRATIVLFAALGQFENVIGGRGSYGRVTEFGGWDVLYELANHHQMGFPSDRDDLLQHRLRISAYVDAGGGWDIAVYAEGVFWDEEIAWSAGFRFSRRF